MRNTLHNKAHIHWQITTRLFSHGLRYVVNDRRHWCRNWPAFNVCVCVLSAINLPGPHKQHEPPLQRRVIQRAVSGAPYIGGVERAKRRTSRHTTTTNETRDELFPGTNSSATRTNVFPVPIEPRWRRDIVFRRFTQPDVFPTSGQCCPRLFANDVDNWAQLWQREATCRNSRTFEKRGFIM